MLGSMKRRSRFAVAELKEGLWRQLDAFRLRLASPSAVLELALLGLLSGILAGLASILFRLIVEHSQAAFLTGPPGSYETLSAATRLLLPIAGGLLLGLLLYRLPDTDRIVGVLHVMERLAYYQGRFPLRNAVVQLLGGAVAIISGHSVGREGPSVHLGVAASNLPAQRFGLPNNSLRLLAASATAAAIAASFNTPLAGVVFALEVLMFEYTVAAFAPVLLATVSATVLSQAVFGPHLAFNVPPIALGSLQELPYVLAMGVLIGLFSAAFIRLLHASFQWAKRIPLWSRPLVAGTIIGVIGMVVPEVMGIGYDTVNQLILGEPALMLVLAIIVLKLIASTTAVGLGIPGGLIGPALVIGAAIGAAFAFAAHSWGVVAADVSAFYVLLGMGAMMAATLQAPLAGLIAILELTGNPHIIFPGILAVIAATLTSGLVHGRESMYLALLRGMGRDYRNDPVAQSLRKVGVGAVMNRSFVQLPRHNRRSDLEGALKQTPAWILLRQKDEEELLFRALDVAHALQHGEQTEELDLLRLPAERLHVLPLDYQATVQEAHELLQNSNAEALYITRTTVPGIPRVYGIMTESEIEYSYRF